MAHEGWRGLPPNIAQLPSADRREQLRILEALLFAASEPLAEHYLSTHLKSGDDVTALLEELKGFYASRGINLVKIGGKWAFRTADDLSYLLERHATEQRRLSKAAMETLAIIAYHQPVTRAEIEEIRGVVISRGTLDMLLEIGWIRPKGRRETPGRPVTWATTDAFLEHFGLESCDALPGIEELKAAGLLDARATVATLGTQGLPGGAPVAEDSEDEEGDVSDMLAQHDAEAADDAYDAEALRRTGTDEDRAEDGDEDSTVKPTAAAASGE
jgi:segregation and condensation protein B